jgi:pilus assembly protein FimV
MLPCAVIQAAGLGKLTLNSALGQPLNAEIDIVATNSDEVQSLKASVATREAYTQAGINYESILSSVKASIESRTNGNPYIKLTSPQAVNDPFLMILMELNWASGRILREYTVLLDPIEANTQNLAAANSNPAPMITATRLDAEKSLDSEKNNQSASSSKSKSGSTSQTKKTYGPVNRGDTLSSIARQVLPAGVDLNQMLVALYRANRDAFIADNMNLLRAGVVLKIPEKSEISAIDTSTAKAEIKTQVGDWRNYQGKLAAISKESPASRTISQSDQGQITTSIDKKSISASGAPKEVLKLSSGAQLLDKDGQIAESTLVDRLRMMEEDAIARNLALQEANQRVAMLEKSIENMKQLLELKDSVLAQAQIKAESVTRQPEVRSPVTVGSLTEKDPNLGMNPSQVQEIPVTQPVTEAVIQNTTVNPPQSPETADRSLADQLFDYIEYIGAALAIVLLLALLILKRRRDQLKDDVEKDDTTKEDFSSSMRSRMASMAAAQTAAPTVDSNQPASEAEDDLAYKNINAYAETEEQDDAFDKEVASYEEDAEHVEKYDSNTASISESQAEDELLPDNLQQNVEADLKEDLEEDYSQFTDSSQRNGSAEFTNEIDFDLSDETDAGKKNLALDQSFSTDSSVKESTQFPDDSESLKEANVSDYALEINFDDPEQHSVNSNVDAEEKNNEGVNFDLANADIDLTEEESSNEIEIPKINDELTEEPLEFDQSPEIAPDTMESESSSKMPEFELADINLDLEEDSNPVDEKVEKADLNDTDEQWQEVETKLDLAKAYLEMDDQEGAKEMLEEVMRDGDTKQQKAAKKMLKNL